MKMMTVKFEIDYEVNGGRKSIKEAIKKLEEDLKKHKGRLSELFNIDIKKSSNRAWN